MKKLLYRYQVFGTKGFAEKMMDVLIKEKPDLKDGYYSISGLRYVVEKDKWLRHAISISHDKDGIIFAMHLYENGYITLGDDGHPGIRPIRWYEPLFLVRLMEKIREIYWWPSETDSPL